MTHIRLQYGIVITCFSNIFAIRFSKNILNEFVNLNANYMFFNIMENIVILAIN
jgi:hypothetical protein